MQPNSETYFFRDHGQFDLLRQFLLPELIERRKPRKTLRLWSAACASGEEPYSLAILIDMLLPKREDWDIVIIGSDINSDALLKARQACYGPWSFRQVASELRQCYFRPVGKEWRLHEQIKRMVSFRSIDLIDTPFPNAELHDMDLILCRNVFIYFDTNTVSQIVDKLTATLSPGGYLMTAHTELHGITLQQDMRSRLFSNSLVYQRHGPTLVPADTSPRLPDIAHRSLTPTIPIQSQPRSGSAVSSPPDVTALLESARCLADRGEYQQAEQLCHQILSIEPLMGSAHFLLAQIAQLQGDFQQAKVLLEKTLYVDPDNTGALLELAALCERTQNLPRAQSLRYTALKIVQQLPGDTLIEPFEMTAAEIAQWLTQCSAA